MLGATAFVLGVAGLFGSAAMMGAENRSNSSGSYGIPSETDNDVSAQVRAVRRKWSGIYNNQRGEWYNQLGPNSAKRSGGSMFTRTKVFPCPRDTSIISAAGISGTPASMGGLARERNAADTKPVSITVLRILKSNVQSKI